MQKVVSSPLVSIVMTAYNAERYIEAALRSLRAQTLTDWELIIVDDGSTDATPAIISEIQNQDARIKIITNRENKGVSTSANLGLNAAKGKYIARMDADDLCFPGRLKAQADFLKKNAGYVLVGSGYQQIDANGAVQKVDAQALSAWECNWVKLFRMPLIHSSLMFRRRIIQNNDIQFNENYAGAADFDFTQQLLRYGAGAVLPDIYVCYRMHPSNVSTTQRDKQQKAASAVSTREVTQTYPQLSPDDTALLFTFIHTNQHLSIDQIKVGLLCLEQLEKLHLQRTKLTSRQQKRLRAFTARWLSNACIRRRLYKNPHAFSVFAWASKRFLSAIPSESASYLLRRNHFYAAKPSDTATGRM